MFLSVFSLIMPYVFTIIGLIMDSVHHFLAMAIFLTVIGVIWTGIRGITHDYGKKGFIISESIHAVIWIIYKVFPNFGMKIVSGVIGFAGAMFVLFIIIVFFVIPFFSDDDQNSGQIPSGNSQASMPNIIYDSNNNDWHLVSRNSLGESTYRDNNGNTVHIFHADVYGSSAQTNAGSFHWY